MPVPRIVLEEGDITNVAVDAIVNAANSSLLGGGGVDGAISTGVFRWPRPDAARIALDTVRATDCSVVQEVRFVLRGNAAHHDFTARLDRKDR